MAAKKKKDENKDEQNPNKDKKTGKSSSADHSFPVAGIGASAGGLEALTQLFEKMPADTGASFVVVQHLAPTKDSAMPELLGRRTSMAVEEVSDNIKIRPNTIYIIPPEKNMTISNGALQLLNQVELTGGVRHPIDYFFRSLARDRGAGAIGIILSGTGTDGTDGARAIKAELGLVIAQNPEEAKYDGMPQSVIDSGLADYVLSTADIPEQIIRYIQHIPDVTKPFTGEPDGLAKVLPKIIAVIRDETGNDFSTYKESTLLRRIKRRMAINQIEEPSQYVRFVQQNRQEILILFKELLINVTSFFRDKEAFDALKAILKERLAQKPDNEEIRAWVLGCATGEEAYSIAIIIREILDDLGKNNKVQVFGTDLDSEAIEIARNGVYRSNVASDVSPERLSRFFRKKEDLYEVNMSIREMLVFANHNITREPPFLKLDLLSVRNLLIYLKGDLQKRLIPLFHYSLRENGILFLSPSETIGENTDLFSVLDRKWKIYQARPSVTARAVPPPYPVLTAASRARPGQTGAGETLPDMSQLADRILMSEYAPPYVIIDSQDNVLFVRGDTSRYLKLADGRATMNIQELARRGLASQLSLAIRSARAQKKEVSRHGIRIDSQDNTPVDILVRPLSQGEQQPEHLMIIFKEVERKELVPHEGERPGPGKKGKDSAPDYVAELEQELKRSREDLQATIEELETSNEEMKSSNEELLSSNEELQSTNEELETSREELRSVNEELSNLNADNQERIEQLNQARDDMANLLNSMDVASIFLDTDLNISSFTPAATKLFSIRESDTGRPFGEIKSVFEYDSWVENARKVLESLSKKEFEVKTKDGKWYLARIQPYRTRENEITGVLLTFFDIDDRRIMEAALHYTQSIVDTVREPMLVLDKELRVVTANRSFYQIFRVTEGETVNKLVFDLGSGQWDIPALRKLLGDVTKKDGHFNNYPVEHDFPLIGKRRMLLNARRLYDELGTDRILLAMEDVTNQPQMEQLFKNKAGEKEDGK